MIGRGDGADAVVTAAELRREDGGEEILGPHPLDRHGHSLPAELPRECERPGRVPAPAVREHRRRESRLNQIVLETPRADHGKDALERKAVLLAEREDDSVVGGCGLELEVEGSAKALAERETERSVHAPAKRGMEDELHAPGLIEKALGDDRVEGRHGAERGQGGADVVKDLGGSSRVDAGCGEEPGGRACRVATTDGDLVPQLRHCRRELRCAGGSFAEPKRDRRRGALGVGDSYSAGLHAADSPRAVPEEEDVPGQTFHGEVLVHSSHENSRWILDDVVIRRVRNRTAAGDGCEAGPAPWPKSAVHAIVVEQGRPAAPPGRDPFGEHIEDRVEIGARESAIGMGAAHESPQILDADFRARHGGHDLLGENVERRFRNRDPIELAQADGSHGGCRLHELVARQGKDDPPGDGTESVTRPADSLQERRQRTRRAEMANEIYVTDVDSEFEGGGGDDHREGSRLEALFGGNPRVAGWAPVMGGDLAFAESLSELVSHALDEAARVDEHQSRSLRANELGDAIVNRGAKLVGSDRSELEVGHLDSEIELAAVPRVHDGAFR